MAAHSILVIDDDPALNEVLADIVSDLDFSPVCALSGTSGLELAQKIKPVAILLDLKMPDIDGMEICKRLRSNSATDRIPILMITGNADPETRVDGLNNGADDYICKPFHREEVQARIRAVLRRTKGLEASSGASTREVNAGNLRIDMAARQVYVAEHEIHLTGTELKVLLYLLSHPNHVVEKQTFLGQFWGSTRVTSRTIDTHVANVRRKLKDWDGAIETVHGTGYVYRARHGTSAVSA